MMKKIKMKHLPIFRQTSFLMKIAAVLILFYNDTSAQVKESPWTTNSSYVGESLYNLQGGNRSSAYYGKWDLTLQFDTKKAKIWPGGTFLVRGLSVHGDTPSFNADQTTWDLQPGSRIEGPSRVGLFEYWYRQQIGKFAITVGSHDMNSQFAVNIYARNLINTSFGIFPSIALPLAHSIYPTTNETVLVQWAPVQKFSLQTAVYNYNPLSLQDDPHNIRWNLASGKIFSISEFRYHQIKDSVETGVYKIGVIYYDGALPSLADPTQKISGLSGIYGSFYQLLKSSDLKNLNGLGAFGQVGYVPGNQNKVNFYASMGLNYKGLHQNRPNDEITAGFVYSEINEALRLTDVGYWTKSRMAIQFNYKFVLRNNITLQPDVQYLINPGGNTQNQNTLIGLLRFSLDI
jgi:porin